MWKEERKRFHSSLLNRFVNEVSHGNGSDSEETSNFVGDRNPSNQASE